MITAFHHPGFAAPIGDHVMPMRKFQLIADGLAGDPGVRVEAHETALTVENARSLIDAYDVILDGTDNFPTRYLVNDACVMANKPNVHGSIFQFEGQATVFYPNKGPCYRCLFPEPPPPGAAPSCA